MLVRQALLKFCAPAQAKDGYDEQSEIQPRFVNTSMAAIEMIRAMDVMLYSGQSVSSLEIFVSLFKHRLIILALSVSLKFIRNDLRTYTVTVFLTYHIPDSLNRSLISARWALQIIQNSNIFGIIGSFRSS